MYVTAGLKYSMYGFQMETLEVSNGLLEDSFAPTVKMSTYLVAFVICDFKSVTATTSSGVQVSLQHVSLTRTLLHVLLSLLSFWPLLCICRCPSMLPLKSGSKPTMPWRLLSKCWTSMRSTSTFAILYPNKVNIKH